MINSFVVDGEGQCQSLLNEQAQEKGYSVSFPSLVLVHGLSLVLYSCLFGSVQWLWIQFDLCKKPTLLYSLGIAMDGYMSVCKCCGNGRSERSFTLCLCLGAQPLLFFALTDVCFITSSLASIPAFVLLQPLTKVMNDGYSQGPPFRAHLVRVLFPVCLEG